MDLLKKGWFTEINDVWPGVLVSLEVNKVLHHVKSEFQDVLVLDTKNVGKLLALDGLIQCTESDEFTYQEAVAFMPLCCHPNPEKVLIVGGGDGGVAREVAKYPSVKSITLVEIDRCVIEAARKYLPFMSIGLDHPKVNLIVGDGFDFMRNHANEFDIIITDNSDPVGPSTRLFEEPYFELLRKALRPGGLISSLAGMVWATPDFVKTTLGYCKTKFAKACYCAVPVPTFPTGQIGFIIASLDPNTDFENPLRVFTEKELDDMKMRYYDDKVHRAATVLPRFIAKALSSETDETIEIGK